MSHPCIPSNPYRFSGPIREGQDFYGRTRELRHVFERIRKHESVNIIGERRSGKTSLLLHLLRPEVQRRHLPDKREELVYVYLDAETVPQRPEGFFHDVLAQAKSYCPDLDIPADESITEQTVRAWLEALAPRRLVLLIDEFEGIASCPKFNPRFFMFLRGLNIGYNVSFVVATCNRLAECCPTDVATSPFPNIFKVIELGAFDKEEFIEFLANTSERGGAPLLEVQEHIQDLAGYHPYLAQMACWHYFEIWLERGKWDEEAHALARHRFTEEALWHFRAVWERYLSSEERKALQALTRGEEAAPPLLWRLERKGHVRDGQVASAVFADFIRQSESSLPEVAAEPLPSMGLWVDDESGQAYLNGELLDPPLPEQQYRLLRLLCQNRGKICTPYMIIEAVWSEDYVEEVDDQRIAQLISRLRKRIEPGGKPWKYILTVHGRGLTLGTGNSEQTEDIAGT